LPINKEGAIFKMETVDGKLYRVMYFKNRGGEFIRSKFPQLVKAPNTKKSVGVRPGSARPVSARPVSVRHVSVRPVSVPQPNIHEKRTVASGNASNLIDEWRSRAK